ncbi:CBS domain-containing protein [Salinirubellus salinus]|jgi:CBS domain-containing protein|uniref:CBS domain-containing protein n=1 Tax=Salinirubellus salinus TaxID=1364945 RepID=A0A9E7R2F6_9EURY|nr:CBS domain-containing protein [Salinirubellus salinus]UWM54530.1 CBS domain-containing protein [Salinirubellus salinus]
MSVAEICSENVVTCYLDDPLLEVADLLQREHVGSVVVLNADDEPSGIVTDRDLVVYGRSFAGNLEGTTVNEVVSATVVTVTPETSVPQLTDLMRESGVRRVPVLDDGTLVGIVTMDDVLVHLADELDSDELHDLAAVVEAESPRPR